MFSNAGTCPRYTQLFNQVVQEPAFVNYDSSFAPLKQKIAAAFGVSVDSLDWEDLFDAFNVINCYDGPLPAGITQEMVDQVSLVSCVACTYHAYRYIKLPTGNMTTL